MYVERLLLADFRSHPSVDLSLDAGVTSLLGPNGVGKTNLVEALLYPATLSSHRVATDAPLVRAGAQRAVVGVGCVRAERRLRLEVEITPGRANRARINGAPVPRVREVLGLLRGVLFAPEDLALVKGDPGDRRRMLDDLLVQRSPRFAGVRSDYERVLRQRNALLKTAAAARRAGALGTLDAWDDHLVRHGADLLAGRLELVAALRPHTATAYAALADVGAGEGAGLVYAASLPEGLLPTGPDDPVPGRPELAEALRTALEQVRTNELERGVTLVGPHRDDLTLTVDRFPAKGYASHGESWTLALSLRLAAFELLRADGDDPVLVLDDVFAELDAHRRDRLAQLAAAAEQVVVTAAVAEDVPAGLTGRRVHVTREGLRHVA